MKDKTTITIGDLSSFGILAISMLLAIVWALGIAPPDSQQGDVQRIFYFHLGSVWPGFAAFFYVLYGSIRYLKSRDVRWDRKSFAAAECGLVFTSIVLITGPIWAKPTWGVWWAWDARLTSMLIMWMMFLGYILLDNYIDNPSKQPRIRAVLGIIGAAMVPFVYMSTRWFETQHPKPVIMGDGDSGIKDPNMNYALLLALIAFTFLTIYCWHRSSEMLNLEDRVKKLRARLNILEEV